MKCGSNTSLLVPATIGLVILILLNLTGDFFFHYDSKIWWQNWFPVYAAFGTMFIVGWRQKCKRCQ